jgi:hypothetical protein
MAAPNQRNMHFTKHNAAYLMNNIIAHDVIHDYGPGGPEVRWEQNATLVRQFTTDYNTFSLPVNMNGGAKRGSAEMSGELDILLPSKTYIPSTIDPAMRMGMGIPQRVTQVIVHPFVGTLTTTYANCINNIKSLKTSINNTIMFTFFTNYLKLFQEPDISGIKYTRKPFKIYNMDLLITPNIQPVNGNVDVLENVNGCPLELYKRIGDKFIGWLTIYWARLERIIRERKRERKLHRLTLFTPMYNYTEIFNLLNSFLLTGAVEQSMYELMDFEDMITGVGEGDGVPGLPPQPPPPPEGDMDIAIVNDYKQFNPNLKNLWNNLTPLPGESTTVIAFNQTAAEAEIENNIGIQRAGARANPLNANQSRSLIAAIEAQLGQELGQLFGPVGADLELMNTIYAEYNREGILGKLLLRDRLNEYDAARKRIIHRFQSIFLGVDMTSVAQAAVDAVPNAETWSDEPQEQKSGSLFGSPDIFPLLKTRYNYRQVDLNAKFKETIEASILDYRKIVAEAVNEEAKRAAAAANEERALLLGKLTTQDKTVRNDFSKLMAISGLYVTQICDFNGDVREASAQVADSPELAQQINILLYIAGWHTNAENIRKGWGTITNADLDNNLFNWFNPTAGPANPVYPLANTRYKCNNTGKYIINNAAPLANVLKPLVFCPWTSILDGMSQCSWNTAVGQNERGNMNFTISDGLPNGAPVTISYNGILTITNPVSTNITITLNIQPSQQFPPLNLALPTNVQKGHDLEASTVLMKTLTEYITYIIGFGNDTATPNQALLDSIFAGGTIFSNLFKLYDNNFIPVRNNGQRNNIYQCIYKHILFKGTGDLFQEINGVCKYGGYTGEMYYTDPGVLSFEAIGDQLRFIASKDRPSGTRAAFMIKRGQSNEINLRAFGGYYDTNNEFIVRRDQRYDPCRPLPLGNPFMNAGKIIKRKTKKNKKQRKTKKNVKKIKRRQTRRR